MCNIFFVLKCFNAYTLGMECCMKIKKSGFVVVLLLFLLFSACSSGNGNTEAADSASELVSVVYLNSYHRGYEWSDGIEEGLLASFRMYNFDTTFTLADGARGNVHVIRMDTKYITNEYKMKQRASEVYEEVLAYKPDLIIASDDNAAKYVIKEYFYNSDIPVVFCGLNWDASVYGFPAPNITGMVEVAPVIQALDLVKGLNYGTSLGYLGADVLSEQKEIDNYSSVLGIKFDEGYLVSTIAEWKQRYEQLQEQVDVLILLNITGIGDWSEKQAVAFIREVSMIPSITTSENMAPYAAVTFGRRPQEQGWWAGIQGQKILEGAKPVDIPLARNMDYRLMINPALIEKVNIVLPDEMIAGADVTEF